LTTKSTKSAKCTKSTSLLETTTAKFSFDRLDASEHAKTLLGVLLSREEEGVNVRDNTRTGYGDTVQQLIELLVVSDCEHDVTRHNSPLPVVTGSVTCELEDFSNEILKDSGEVNRGASTNRLLPVLLHMSSDAANRECETRTSGLAAASTTSSAATATTKATATNIAVEFGHGLGSFGNGVLGKLTRQVEPNRSLNLSRSNNFLLIDTGKVLRFDHNAKEQVLNEVVHDLHRLHAQPRIGVHLLEHFVYVRGIAASLWHLLH